MSGETNLDKHILNIVQNFDIREQIDLQRYLKKRGYNTPQATLSRHLKKLKIAKVNKKYRILDHNQFQPLPIVLNIKVSDFGIIVLHTYPGNANSLAFFLDKEYVSFTLKEQKTSPILGTIAGDDTVLIITKNKNSIKEAIKLLKIHFSHLDRDDLE